jgi:hypothetical protein
MVSRSKYFSVRRQRRIATRDERARGTRSSGSFRLGEGLIGECARSRKVVTLTNLPANYLRIASAVGHAPPVQTTAFPVLSKDALLGVLEVASLRPFMAREQSLFDEVLPVAAMSLEILQRNLHTQERARRSSP